MPHALAKECLECLPSSELDPKKLGILRRIGQVERANSRVEPIMAGRCGGSQYRSQSRAGCASVDGSKFAQNSTTPLNNRVHEERPTIQRRLAIKGSTAF